jgi:UDP-2-acetamido-2,6-beta-L-arabino-hexul-4-ose reductase
MNLPTGGNRMKILITGAKGFVGKNLISELKNRGNLEIFQYDVDSSREELSLYTKDCDFVYHLAGINRPKNEEEFMLGNFGFTSVLLENLKKNKNKAPILISSSIQATLDNAYGKSKKAGEDLLFQYSEETGARVCIYRLPNVFGKWSRPNYNSAVATFCNNIASDIPIVVNDSNAIVNLVYIDDVVNEFVSAMNGDEHIENGYCFVPTVYKVRLGEIVELLTKFKNSRNSLSVPFMGNAFEKALYSTYLSYLPKDKFSYPLKMNIDNRGSFTEIIKTEDRGQFSVNISKPGITKGNHWHHSKNEKFVVVKGKALIQFRQIGTNEVLNYHVSGDKIEVVDIPTGYTHNIINEGEEDLVTFMWANEAFDPKNPDTFFEVVE